MKSSMTILIYLSCAFVVFFTAFNASQLLMGQIYSQLNLQTLGKINYFSTYLIVMFFSILAPPIVRKFGYKKCIVVPGIAYISSYIVGIYLTACGSDDGRGICQLSTFWIYVVNIVLFAAIGASGALVFTAQQGIISAIATKEEVGTYFGFFNSIFSMNDVIGPLVSTVLFHYFNHFHFYVILMIVGAIGWTLFLCIPPIDSPKATNTDITSPLTTTDNEKPKEETPSESLVELLKGTFRNIYVIARKEEVSGWLWLMFVQGGGHTAIVGYLYQFTAMSQPEDITKEALNAKTAQILVVLGAFEVLAGYIFGKTTDKFGIPVLSKIALLSWIVGLLLCGVYSVLLPYYWVMHIFGAIWGFGHIGITTINSSIAAKYFDGKLEFFALIRVGAGGMRAIAFMLLIINDYMPTTAFLIFLILLFGLSFFKTLVQLARYPKGEPLVAN